MFDSSKNVIVGVRILLKGPGKDNIIIMEHPSFFLRVFIDYVQFYVAMQSMKFKISFSSKTKYFSRVFRQNTKLNDG